MGNYGSSHTGQEIDNAVTLVNGDIPAAAEGGTTKSLVTTGDKYNWNNKQSTLISGINIKTINNRSILGSGNIDIETESLNLVKITYEDLKERRDNGQLVPGQFYRMIDYDTVTSGDNISVANHSFDLILLALDESHLSENAWACHSERDTEEYFKYSNLEAWEIRYCLDNDQERFEWACSEGTIIVIPAYVTLNFLPTTYATRGATSFTIDLDKVILVNNAGTLRPINIDFYAIRFVDVPEIGPDTAFRDRYVCIKKEASSSFLEALASGNEVFLTLGNENAPIEYQTIESSYSSYTYEYHEEEIIIIKSKGVIYSLKDEFGNECPYDFKNILFHKGVYTFDTAGGGYYDYNFMLGGEDASINPTMNVHNNIIKPWIESGIQKLNWNLFRGESFFNNVYECDCHHNLIKTNAHNNHFLEDVNNNTFQPDASGNTLGCHARENTFGRKFYCNDVGIHVKGCTFGNECQDNKIGNQCTNIKFGDNCKRNVINSGNSGLTLASGTEDCEYI